MSRIYAIILSFATIVVALDQWSKAFIVKLIPIEGQSLPFLSWFDWVLVYNPAAAFGMFGFIPDEYRKWFFYFMTPIILIIFWFSFVKKLDKKETLMPIALGLVLGGALGNYIDRFTYGKVVDFVDWFYTTSSESCIPLFSYHGNNTCHWPAFNVADISINVAFGLIVISQIILAKNDKKE